MATKITKLSVVIPAHNEQNTILDILDKVFTNLSKYNLEVVVVDDASRDATADLVIDSGRNIKLIRLTQNVGKSQAVKTGLLATSGDWVVIQDADLEYDPQDLLQFVDLIQRSDVDVIYGNRFGKHNPVVYWQNWIGNRFLSLLSSVFTYSRSRMWTSDMEVCYKMARGDVFRDIASRLVSTSKFGLEPELTARFSKYRLNSGQKLKFAQLPISYKPRTTAEGKKIRVVHDGVAALWEILKFNLGKYA